VAHRSFAKRLPVSTRSPARNGKKDLTGIRKEMITNNDGAATAIKVVAQGRSKYDFSLIPVGSGYVVVIVYVWYSFEISLALNVPSFEPLRVRG